MSFDGASPDSQYNAKLEARRRFDADTQEQIRQRESKISELRREHLDLMKSAADHAGNLGFMYRPQTNQYVCIVSTLEEAPEWAPTPHDVPVEPDEPQTGIQDDGPDHRPELEPDLIDDAQRDQEADALSNLRAADQPDDPQDSEATGAPGELEEVIVDEFLDGFLPFPEPEPSRPSPPLPAIARRHQGESKIHRLNPFLGFILPLFVSAFVGFGLGTLAGFNVSKPGIYLYLSLFLGVAVIYGLKLLFHEQWSQYGKSVAIEGRPLWIRFTGLSLLTLKLILLEAGLGANALMQFSLRTAFDPSHAIGWAVAIPCAMAVTSPVMLLAAFSGYRLGRESVSDEEVEARRAQQIYEAEVAEFERKLSEHNRRRAEWDSLQLRKLDGQTEMERRRAELEQRLLEEEHERRIAAILPPEDPDAKWRRMESERQEMEKYRRQPDYQALMQSIGRIAVLRLEIAEAKRDLTNFKVSRGYEKGSL